MPFPKITRISGKIYSQNRQRGTQMCIVVPLMQSYTIFLAQDSCNRKFCTSFSNRTSNRNQFNVWVSFEIFSNIFFKFSLNSFFKHNLIHYNIKSPLFQAVIYLLMCAHPGRFLLFIFIYKCYLGEKTNIALDNTSTIIKL